MSESHNTKDSRGIYENSLYQITPIMNRVNVNTDTSMRARGCSIFETTSIKQMEDFSPPSNFDKNYNKVLNEFSSIGIQSPLLQKLVTDETEQKLRLKALQNQISLKNKTQAPTDTKSKLKELRMGLFENTKPTCSNMTTRLRTDAFTSDKGYLTKQNNTFTENEDQSRSIRLIKSTATDDNKINFLNHIKTTNNINERITKENLMADFKLFNVSRPSDKGKVCFEHNGK
jgi:hypothetical protein